MACQIAIRSINGVVPVGATQSNPTHLRVTGTAFGCTGGVLLTSNVTAPMASGQARPIDGNGRFVIDEPILPGVAVSCGDQVNVTVTCASDPNCADADSVPLKCCELTINEVVGFGAQKALAPTAILVSGTLRGCATDQVEVWTDPAVTTPVTQTVDQATGVFSVELPVATALPPGTLPPLCGSDHFVVHARCKGATGSAGCGDVWKRTPLPCTQCFRAQIAASVGPCSGNPPMAPVTFTAQVALPANGTGQFEWHHPDGSVTGPFPVTISSGAPQATITIPPETKSYPAGTHTVELRRVDVGECPPAQYTFTVNCAGCPQVSVSVSVGACVTAPGPLKDSRPVIYTLGFTPPLGTDTAWTTFSYGGPDANGMASSAAIPFTGAGPHSHTANLKHKPTGYTSTAAITVISAQGAVLCQPPQIAVSFATPGTNPPAVGVDPCLPCPMRVKVTEDQPMPALPAPHRRLTAEVEWASPPAPPPPPPSPVSFDWTIRLPDGREAKILNGPAVITTQAGPNWTWTGPGSSGGAVDLTQPGAYSVSAHAKFASNSGLPSDPVTGVSSCVLTGSWPFTIAGSVTPPTTPPPTTPPKTPSFLCDLLLVLAITLLLVGAIVVVIGVCIGVWPVNLILILIGAALGTIGLVLFIIWAFVCAATTPCPIIWTMFCILDWIVKTAWILVIVAGIVGGLPCALAAASAWGGWGLLLSVYMTIMFRVGCPPIDCTAPRPGS